MSSPVTAQLTNGLDKILPVDMVDSRGGITRSVAGMDFMVRIFITEAIKNIDACSDADYGHLSVEIMWYDKNTELGDSQIEMIGMMEIDKQQKEDFLGKGTYKDLAGGSLVIETASKECINEITGPTGKIQHSTDAKYFSYTGSAIVKIGYAGKVKAETATNIITKVAGEIKKFDFSIYKNVTADEKSK